MTISPTLVPLGDLDEFDKLKHLGGVQISSLRQKIDQAGEDIQSNIEKRLLAFSVHFKLSSWGNQ
jgi:hypothetical protein